MGREGYIIGVPEPGEYCEVFNSDRAEYGGSDKTHAMPLLSGKAGWGGWPSSLAVGVPPLGFVCFKKA